LSLVRAWLAISFCIGSANAIAQTAAAALPELMSLSQALALSDRHHPQVLKHAAQVQAAQAVLHRDEQEGRCQYDGVKSAQVGLDNAQRQQRIDIIHRFFAVLAADLRFAADNEAMSLAFFPFSRADERRERFGSVSELEVMEKRVGYFAELEQRNQSLRAQRSTRLKLALAMGLPRAKPDYLIEPDLSIYDRETPDFDDLLEQVLLSSPLIRQKTAQLAQLKLVETRFVGETPCVGLDMLLAANIHPAGHQNSGFTLSSIDAHFATLDHAALLAIIAAEEAEFLALDFRIREQVLKWVQTLEKLKQQIEQNAQNLAYRERALDKSRLLYEMEVSAQIGQAQADMAKLLWQDARSKYRRAMIWEKIDAALAKPEVNFE
jgi:hypothetical protein